MAQAESVVSFQEMIRRKRDGGQISSEEIRAFVQGVTLATIQESQIGAMLMAIWMKGMVAEETLALTKEMMMSGEVFHWPEEWAGLVVDKHSTGGVGDKVSLPLAPALAACGCKVPMISGRGLAHTGGTLDKLESIPGFNIHQTVEQVKQILQDVGCCIVGQTENLVPADRVLYALRDATATVESLPLITGSIISKKGAERLCALLLDVKFGRAALYKDQNSARTLARSLVTVGNSLGMKTGAVLSRMDAPIGHCVGNALEVCEALECLKGRGPDDLKELVISLGGFLLWMSNRSPTPEKGQMRIAEVLRNGAALHIFQAMLEAQGVSTHIAHSLCLETTDYSKHLRHAEYQTKLQASSDGEMAAPEDLVWENGGGLFNKGTVLDIDGMVIATVLHKLGAGRTQAGESINHSVGAELLVHLGQQVQKGESWITIHHDCPVLSPEQRSVLQGSLVVGKRDSYQPNGRVVEFIEPN